ncbi:MAG TPA: hypothetical protein VGN16_09525 [Acidobacteriaceae bacterium]|jgi:hypothetical protein
MPDEDDKSPSVVIMPTAQAQIDADPQLAKAMQGFREAALNAMQGVKDGRYRTFEEGMEALTGHKPEPVVPRYQVRFGYYMCVGPDPAGGDLLMAIISDGNPKEGHSPIEILDVDRFRTKEEADKWFETQCILEPWADTED